jgi:crossover junction endodeoxyribonuclease RuvC
MLILGIDPGLNRTGWGVIRQEGNRLSLVACGVIKGVSSSKLQVASKGIVSLATCNSQLATRLHTLSTELTRVIETYKPDEAAIEETFVNVSGQSTLKLGQARGALLLTLAQNSLPVAEYAATLVKKSVTGSGRAEKEQVAQMVRMLLPGCGSHGADAMDALAVAITHAHHRKLPVASC